MTASTTIDARPPFATRAIATLSVLTFALHIFVDWLSPYGFQRDEFLYMAMGRHLQLWRMDFPPFIAILSQVQRFLLGDSIVAIRFAPAVAAGLLVLMAALISREMGGGRVSQLFAAIAVATSPVFIRTGVLFQPVVFDELWWTLALYALARLGAESTRDDMLSTRPRWWIALGIACGIGLLTKFSLLFFGAALVLALIVAPQRRVMLSRWPWIAAAIAIVLGSPSIVGQLRLGFPVVGQMRTLESSQLMHVSFKSFILGPTEHVRVVLRELQLKPLIGARRGREPGSRHEPRGVLPGENRKLERQCRNGISYEQDDDRDAKRRLPCARPRVAPAL